MADRAVVDVDRAFHNERLARLDAGDEIVISREGIFDVSCFADTLKSFLLLIGNSL